MFTLLAEHRMTLNQLAGLTQEEQDYVAEIYSDAGDITATLKYALQKADEKFVVLFIGGFACGKTSMINALIGEDLLPTSFLPETAVLGELHYGTKKRITLYPKKGKWEGGDEPFDLREVTTEEISRYVSLSTEDAINSMEKNIDGDESQSRINAKFEKMVIYWPLDILKDGVVLVDTPGINNPYSNDYIVNDCLPKADAIVYVMDSTKAYTAFDKEQLEKVNTLGRRDIITAYTFYDNIERQWRKDPIKLATLRKILTDHMLKHTNLGELSIHFLDSIGGFDAKIDNDRDGLRRSGFEGFEDYLGRYLVESRGTAQVKCIINAIINQAHDMIKDVQILTDAAQIELEQVHAEAEKRLQAAHVEMQQIGENFRRRLEESLPAVEQMLRAFLIEELPEHIDLKDFQPETNLPTGIIRFNPMECRKKFQIIKSECAEEILRRINFEYKVWTINVLDNYFKSIVEESMVGNNFTAEPFIANKIVLPVSLFWHINDIHIISRNEINSTDKIKFLVAKYAKEFFRDVSTKEEVDNMVSDIMSDVKSYVEKTCVSAEKIIRDEVENTERLVRRMVEDGKASLEEKTAQISQRNAAIDKLNNIKDQALRIGRDYGIRF
ncbi:MAG: dynamin family protein [Selenomonadaceae bacterium]|nr:dynamin family protein [Selenomonadaceae bacterium]